LGKTPLHVAAGFGHVDVVVLLLARQADINARDNGGKTPRQLAKASGHHNVAELLRRRGGQD
jgi:ankyrin repeat protein